MPQRKCFSLCVMQLGRTPAYVAACEGHAEVLRVLLDCPSIDVMLSAEVSR